MFVFLRQFRSLFVAWSFLMELSRHNGSEGEMFQRVDHMIFLFGGSKLMRFPSKHCRRDIRRTRSDEKGFFQEFALITTGFSVHSATVSWLMLIWSGVTDCLLGTRNLGKSRFDSTPYLRLWMTAEVGEEHEDNTYLWLFCLAKLKEVIFQQRDFNLYCLDDLPDLVDPVKVRFGVLGSMLGYALIFKDTRGCQDLHLFATYLNSGEVPKD